MHRVIARPGDEEALHAYASHTKGDSGEAFVHTERANASENRVRPWSGDHYHAQFHAELGATDHPQKAYHHARTGMFHRVLAHANHTRADNIEDEPGFQREARISRETAEAHLHAAALHEAAAYHHRNKS